MPRTRNLKIGQGTIVRIAANPTGNTNPSYTKLDDVKSVTLASPESARVDATSFDSGGMRQTIPGLKEAGETTFTGLWDAGQAQDTLIAGFRDNDTEVRLQFEIPNSSANSYIETHQGFITKYDRNTNFESLGEFTVTMAVNKITYGS